MSLKNNTFIKMDNIPEDDVDAYLYDEGDGAGKIISFNIKLNSKI